MAVQLDSGTLEARIVRLIQARYPITFDQLVAELHLTEKRVRIAVKRLAAKGIIARDVLPDAEYLRLARGDISFIGRKADQRRPVKHTGRARPPDEPEENLNVYR